MLGHDRGEQLRGSRQERSSTAASPTAIESVMSQVEANHAARWAEAAAIRSAADPPQVGRIGGSRTPARKHVPDSTNSMPVAR